MAVRRCVPRLVDAGTTISPTKLPLASACKVVRYSSSSRVTTTSASGSHPVPETDTTSPGLTVSSGMGSPVGEVGGLTSRDVEVVLASGGDVGGEVVSEVGTEDEGVVVEVEVDVEVDVEVEVVVVSYWLADELNPLTNNGSISAATHRAPPSP